MRPLLFTTKKKPSLQGPATLAEEMLMETEASVMANFDFLAREDDLEDEDEVMAEEGDDGFHLNPKGWVAMEKGLNDKGWTEADKDTEKVLNEFNFLTQAEVSQTLEKQTLNPFLSDCKTTFPRIFYIFLCYF